jgi:hypothetical protein
MAYTKQTWADGDPTKPLSANRMNYMEQGIQDAHALNSPDPVVIHVADEGAIGNFIADDRAAIQSAITKAENIANTGLPAVVQLMRRHRIGSPGLVVNRGGWKLQGYGAPTGTVIGHTDAYNNGWLMSVYGADRQSTKTADKATYLVNDDDSGLIIDGVHFTGVSRTNVKHGLRVTRADDMRMFNTEFSFMRGVGLQLGDIDGAVANSVGAIRESHFLNTRVMFCGDGENVPAMQIGNSPNGASDGTNQLYFLQLDMVYNWGGLHIVNHHDLDQTRRIQIHQMQNHGISHANIGGNQTNYDLIKIEGQVNDVTINTLITNSSGASHAVLRTVASPVTGRTPRGIIIDNMSCSSAEGDVFVFEKAAEVYVLNARPSLSGIAGAFIRIPTGSGIGSYSITGGQTSSTDYSSKFVIASDVIAKGYKIWSPTDLPGSGGGSTASPYAAFIVDDSSGTYPLRSDVTSDSTRPVICVGDTNPYTSGRGYLTGKDVWLDPQ